MKIAVCAKQVPDTESIIKVMPEGDDIDKQGITYVLNPYDEFAIEEALTIKEQLGGEITLYCLGPENAEKVLRTGLSMGCDKAVHLLHKDFDGSDSHAAVIALSKAMENGSFDLILCGKEATDDNCSFVGIGIAENLNIPHISLVVDLKLDFENKNGTASRETETGLERVEFSLPALITCQKGLNDPRLPSIRGIMAAKKKEISVFTPIVLGLHHTDVGAKGSNTIIIKYIQPPPRGKAKIFSDEPGEAVKKVLKLLREEAKVI